MTALPDLEGYQMAHSQAQSLFADDLPAMPLYQRLKVIAMRPDMCNVDIDPAFGSALSTIEIFDYNEGCE